MGNQIAIPPNIPGFEIISRLGVGGMSVVWKAKETATGNIFAVKVLNREFTSNKEDLEQFKKEEFMMEKIDHPGIVKSYKMLNIGEMWCFIMEYVDGYNFGQLLQRKQHLSEYDCLLICQCIAASLDFVWNEHKIIHCDIKPENIMITSRGEIKLTDLGLCDSVKTITTETIKPTEYILSTPAYVSPEQIYKDVQIDFRADIYSLAATLYHLATGRVIYPKLNSEETMRAHCDETKKGKSPRYYHPELSIQFCQLLERMLVKDRDCRIGSWQEVFNLAQMAENKEELPEREFPDSPSSIELN
jgi:serine/threonine-protein kinase